MSISNRLKKAFTIIPMAGIILFSSVNVNAELGDALLKKGSNNQDVQVLQEKLIELKFLDIDQTTTYYNDATVQAVKDFQAFYGLTADGAFGSKTFEVFEKVTKFTALEFKEILRVNSEGEEVKALQERLEIMGFLSKEDIDSKYGPTTEQAVKDFQEMYQLTTDGIAGEATINAINQALSGSKRMKRPTTSRGGLSSRDSGIISSAKKYLGVPYRFGGTSSSGFDCSGFTQTVYKSQGINVPRTTSGQAAYGTRISKSELTPGDLVIFSGTYKSGPSHAGIYLGNGDFIHSSSNRGVTINNLNENYYSRHFSYGRKVK